MPQQRLKNLIGGHYVIKAHERHRIHKPGIVSIEGDDVLNSHALQFLQSDRAVEAFTDNAAMLPATVQARHNHSHAMRSASHSLDQPLQIGKVIIGRHMIFLTEQIVGQAVIARIHDNENVIPADGLLHQSLRVTTLKPGTGTVNDKRILFNANFLRPCAQMTINQIGQFLRTGAGNQSKMRDLRIRIEKFGRRDIVIRHGIFSPPSQFCINYSINYEMLRDRNQRFHYSISFSELLQEFCKIRHFLRFADC